LDTAIKELEVNITATKQDLSKQAMQSADPNLYDFRGPAYRRGKQLDAKHEDIEKRVEDYEKEINSRQVSGSAPSFLPPHAERYRANCDYNPRDTEQELKLRENDILWVLQKKTKTASISATPRRALKWDSFPPAAWSLFRQKK